MTKLPRLLPLLALLLLPLLASADPAIDAVRQADDARVAATIAGDRAKLEAIFSDDLNYAHSTGVVNDKATFVVALTDGHLKHQSITFEERKFSVAAPGVVLATGRCLVKETKDGKPAELHLNFLEVWRLEGDTWRFLAWQSCRLP